MDTRIKGEEEIFRIKRNKVSIVPLMDFYSGEINLNRL